MRRVSELESHRSFNSTPKHPRSHSHVSVPVEGASQLNHAIPRPTTHQNVGLPTSNILGHSQPQTSVMGGVNHPALQPSAYHQSAGTIAPIGRAPVNETSHNQDPSGNIPSVLPPHSQPPPSGPQHQNQGHSSGTDDIIPGINTLRQNPSISQLVAQVLASYEAQIKQDVAQGKPSTRKSGQYNTTETVTSAPEFRWPNEGKKRSTYDDLTLSEWAVGQLSNIYYIQDPSLVKKVLLQTILALKDATSLPWQAVRAAYGNSMHEVEQGTLTWDNQMQWAINRLSTSQIAMANSNTVTNQQKLKVCKYFNENMCQHEGNHGQFRHMCSFCVKSGKSFSHPETKCYAKQRGQQGVNNK